MIVNSSNVVSRVVTVDEYGRARMRVTVLVPGFMPTINAIIRGEPSMPTPEADPNSPQSIRPTSQAADPATPSDSRSQD